MFTADGDFSQQAFLVSDVAFEPPLADGTRVLLLADGDGHQARLSFSSTAGRLLMSVLAAAGLGGAV
jgi:hypothetical protein